MATSQMTVQGALALIVLLAHARSTSSQSILTAPIVTHNSDWKWSNWADCPADHFVKSAAIKVATVGPDGKHKKDSLGIYSVMVECRNIDDVLLPSVPKPTYIGLSMDNVGNPSVKSAVPPREANLDADDDDYDGSPNPKAINKPPTTFKPEDFSMSCEGVGIGFSLRADKVKLSSDSSGANNMRLHCSDMRKRVPDYQEGYGYYEGTWTEPQMCPPQYALCGIQVQSDSWRPNLIAAHPPDYIGINTMRMKCCRVPNPALNCTPSDRWEVLSRCIVDPNDDTLSYTCNYHKIVGLGANSVALGDEDFSRRYFYEGVGYEVDAGELPFWLTSGLSTNFARNMTVSVAGFDWKVPNEAIWRKEMSVEEKIEATSKKTVVVEQLVGRCAWFHARTPQTRLSWEKAPIDVTTTTSTTSTTTVSTTAGGGGSVPTPTTTSTTATKSPTPKTTTENYDYGKLRNLDESDYVGL